MADSHMEREAGGATGVSPGFKLFGTRIVTETTQPRNEDQPTSETSPQKPPATTTTAAGAGGGTSSAATAATPTGLACPRCKSRETKFCYFNNYNVNQPRHFCRGCHRYWTAGGALRNVPIGAGRRKAGMTRPSSQVDAGSVFSGLDGVVVQKWLMSHEGFPTKRPNITSFPDRIR